MDEFLDLPRREYKISEEDAKKQVIQVMEYYDFDVNDMAGDDSQETVKTAIKQTVKFIRQGKVEVVEGDKKPYIKQHLSSGDVLEYKGNISDAKSAMDGHASTARTAMMIAFMGSLSGVGSNAIRRLDDRDFKIMETVAAFLSSLTS